MSYYTFTSKELEKSLNTIQYGAEAAALIERQESEITNLRASLEAAEQQLQRAALEIVQNSANRLCTNKGDHPSTFILGWREAEAFHNIGTVTEGSTPPNK